MLGTVLGILHILTHLILRTTLFFLFYFKSHNNSFESDFYYRLPVEETGTERLSKLTKLTQLLSG